MNGDLKPWERVSPLVYELARSVGWKHREYAEEEDIAQSIWVYWFEHERALVPLLDDEAAYGVLRARLRSAGARYAVREMAYRLGMDPDDQLDYSLGEVRALIRFVVAGGPEGTESADTWARWADLQRAWSGLPQGDVEALTEAYGDEDRAGLSSAARARVWRAVKRLRDVMNTPVGA